MKPLLKNLQATLKTLPPFKKVVVGCSGGADSVALAHALKTLGYEVILAHLNHGLRGAESDTDERFVKRLASKWKLVFEGGQATISSRGNLENQARKARIVFLEGVRKKTTAEFIALGHHLDDQIETILMHMARGAGLRGQRGMLIKNEGVIRPLLNSSRAQIEAYIKENHLEYRTDWSNHDLSFDRNFWRHLIIPYLKRSQPDLARRILNISKRAAKKLGGLHREAWVWRVKKVEEKGGYFNFSRSDFATLSPEVQMEVLIGMTGAQDVYRLGLLRLRHFLTEGHSGKQMSLGGKTFVLEHDRVLFSEAESPPQPLLRKIKLGAVRKKWGPWKVRSTSSLPLFVRPWKKGDRFRPSGMQGHQKLQDFFVNHKIPRHLREQIPVVVDENDVIMAVGNLRLANEAGHLKDNLSIQKAS